MNISYEINYVFKLMILHSGTIFAMFFVYLTFCVCVCRFVVFLFLHFWAKGIRVHTILFMYLYMSYEKRAKDANPILKSKIGVFFSLLWLKEKRQNEKVWRERQWAVRDVSCEQWIVKCASLWRWSSLQAG